MKTKRMMEFVSRSVVIGTMIIVWSLFQMMLIGLKLAQVGEVAQWYWWYVLIPTEVPVGIIALSALEKSPVGQWFHGKAQARAQQRKAVARRHLRVIK